MNLPRVTWRRFSLFLDKNSSELKARRLLGKESFSNKKCDVGLTNSFEKQESLFERKFNSELCSNFIRFVLDS